MSIGPGWSARWSLLTLWLMTLFCAVVAAGNVLGALRSAGDREWGEVLVRPMFAVLFGLMALACALELGRRRATSAHAGTPPDHGGDGDPDTSR